MATALWILLWIVAAVVAAILVLVVTPTVFLLDAAFGGGARARVSVRPLGGLVPAIPVFDSAAARPASRKTVEKRKQKTPGRGERRSRSGGGERARRVVAALPDLVCGVIGTVHVERLALDLDFGTGDPADTGAIYGALAPFLHGAWHGCLETVDLRPDFTQARLDGTASARVRFTPAALLAPAVRFGWAAFGSCR